MDAQGLGEAGTSLSATVEHDNDGTGSPEWSSGDGKTEQEERRTAAAPEPYRAAKEVQGSHDEAFSAPTRRPDGHAHDWKQAEARRRCSASGDTVHNNYKFAIRQNSQITLKFS